MNVPGIYSAVKVWIASFFGSYRLYKIDEGLYQSGKIGLGGLKKLEKEGINVVVDLQGGFDVELYVSNVEDLVYILWPIKDEAELPALLVLHNLATAVSMLRENGFKVLTHCSAGFNRSGLFNGVVLACSPPRPHGQVIIDKIRAGRPGALYNQTFVDYLMRL